MLTMCMNIIQNKEEDSLQDKQLGHHLQQHLHVAPVPAAGRRRGTSTTLL
jgi:hypothetical protein